MVKNAANLCLAGIAAIALLNIISVAIAADTFVIDKPDSTVSYGYILSRVNPYDWATGVFIGGGVSLDCAVMSIEVPTFMKWEKIGDRQNINYNSSVFEKNKAATLLKYVITNYTTADAGVYQCTAHLGEESYARPKIVSTQNVLSHHD